MLACIMDTLRQFSSFGFHVSLLIVDRASHVSLLIVDRASPNLTTLILLICVRGIFGHDDNLEDKHMIEPCVCNPFNWKNMYLLICPSHQVNLMTF